MEAINLLIYVEHYLYIYIMQPDLTKTLLSADLDEEQGKIAAKRAGKAVKGLQHFMTVHYYYYCLLYVHHISTYITSDLFVMSFIIRLDERQRNYLMKFRQVQI